MAVIALREEASPELEQAAKRLHWVSLGELSRKLELLHQECMTRLHGGQVKHKKIFSASSRLETGEIDILAAQKEHRPSIGAAARVSKEEAIEIWIRRLF